MAFNTNKTSGENGMGLSKPEAIALIKAINSDKRILDIVGGGFEVSAEKLFPAYEKNGKRPVQSVVDHCFGIINLKTGKKEGITIPLARMICKALGYKPEGKKTDDLKKVIGEAIDSYCTK